MVRGSDLNPGSIVEEGWKASVCTQSAMGLGLYEEF